MPKVTDEYRQARRDEIIEVAIGCFLTRGYGHTSIADLVAASGLSAGAIYGNFPGGRDEIFVAAATRILDSRRLDLEMARREGPLSPADIMTTLITGIRSEAIGPILPQLWGEAVVQPDILVLVTGVFAQLRSTIHDAVADWAHAHPDRIDGDPDEWAHRVTPVILSTAPGYILQQAVMPDFDGDAYLAALREVLPH